MSTDYKKIFNTLSQLAQLSNLQQYVQIDQAPITKDTSKVQIDKQVAPDRSNDPSYIYIGKEDLVKLFPQLEGKLDLDVILKALIGKLPVTKNLFPQSKENKDENKRD